VRQDAGRDTIRLLPLLTLATALRCRLLPRTSCGAKARRCCSGRQLLLVHFSLLQRSYTRMPCEMTLVAPSLSLAESLSAGMDGWATCLPRRFVWRDVANGEVAAVWYVSNIERAAVVAAVRVLAGNGGLWWRAYRPVRQAAALATKRTSAPCCLSADIRHSATVRIYLRGAAAKKGWLGNYGDAINHGNFSKYSIISAVYTTCM